MSFVPKSVCLLALLFASAVTWADQWIQLDYPGAVSTFGSAVSGVGDVVGDYFANGVDHGFLWHDGNFSNIDVPGANDTIPEGINVSGAICGYYDDQSGTHGFLLEGSSVTALNFPGATTTYSTGINDSGDVVGIFVDANFANHAYKWNSNSGYEQIPLSGTQTQIYGISNPGFIFGTLYDAHQSFHRFLINPQGFIRYFDMQFGTLTLYGGPNDHNTVVGEIKRQHGADAIRWNLTTGASGTIRIPSSNSTHGVGINNAGQVAGYYVDQQGKNHGFLWTP